MPTIELQLNGGEKHEFEAAAAEEAISKGVAALGGALDALAKEWAPERWYLDRGSQWDEKTLGQVLEKFFEASQTYVDAEDKESEDNPKWVATDVMSERGDGDDEHIYSAFQSMKGSSGYKAVRKALCAAAAAAEGDDPAHAHRYGSEVDDALRDALIERMGDLDESTPLDTLHDNDDVEVCVIPGYRCIDDQFMSHTDVVFSSTTVIPDENFAALLKFVNWSGSEYAALVKEKCGVDLTAEPDPEDFDREYRYNSAKQLANQWRGLVATVDSDPERDKLVGGDSLIELMDNASYGGVPAFVCRIPAKAALEHDWSHAMKLTGRGWIAIHDPINGSGHSVNIESKGGVTVTRPADFYVSAIRGYSIESIYGPDHRSMRVDVEKGPALGAEPAPDAAGPRM
jgi:hypothetical protein